MIVFQIILTTNRWTTIVHIVIYLYGIQVTIFQVLALLQKTVFQVLLLDQMTVFQVICNEFRYYSVITINTIICTTFT